MARIARKFQKIFALNATNNGVFGSAADGTKVLDNDPVVLQSKPAFLTGWLDAVIGTKKFPPLEEFQSLNYINTYQLAYLFQEGIREFDASTTYYIKSIVRKSGTYQLYGSIIDNNTGNALPNAVSDANWQYLTDLSAVIAQATESVAGIAEIATALEVALGIDDQRIVTPLKLAAWRVPTGAEMGFWGSAAPTGWVLASGRTIGSATSGATERANADTETLFTLLWNSTANTELPIQNSAGSATTRGANAAADFAANKRLPVPDMRGRVGAGKDNMGGTPAGRLSGQPFGVNGLLQGAAGGQESHTQTTAELAAHAHTGGISGVGPGKIEGFGGGAPGVDNYDPQDTGSTGSSSPMNVVQPTIIRNVIIKL